MKNRIKEILREGIITEITVNDAWTKFYSNVEKFPALRGDESLFNKLNDLYPRRGDNFNKGYFTWLYNLIRTNQLKEEDFYKAKEYLRLFDKFINKIPAESRDINKFKNLNDLYDVVKEFEEGEDTMATSNKDEIRQIKQNEIDKVYEDGEWLIMIPKTERASCLIGKGTKWCTAADESNNMFDNYNSDGPLYVLIDKYNDEKYQLHFESNQLMDATDRPVAASYFFDSVMDTSGPFEFLQKANDKFWDFILETSVDDMASGGYSEVFEEALTSDVTPSVLKKTLETLRYGEDSRGVYLGYVYEKDPYNIDKYEIEHFFEHIDTMDEYDLDAILRHLNDIEYDFDETDNASIKIFMNDKLELEKHGVELDTTYEIDKGKKIRVNRINIGAEKPYNVTMDNNSGDMDLETLLNLLHNGQLFETKFKIKNSLRKNFLTEIYGKNIVDVVTKKFNDTSEVMKNKLAISSLFRNIFGDINQFKTKEQFDVVYNKWYGDTLTNLTKTTSFPENRELAKKYLDAYITNIKSLGQAAMPFSMKKIEIGLVDLVNNNRWINDTEIKQGNTIYNPKTEDVVYENNNVIILDTNTKAKCVLYGQGESWCITKPELNYYNTYRLSYKATPYFVLQKNVNGDEQKLVIMNYGYRGYAIADRSNTGSRSGSSSDAMQWYEIEEQLPNLQGLERYFPYREITDDENRYAEMLDKIKANFIADDLQDLVDRSIKGLIINGSQVTPADFIRDLAANQMAFKLEQLQSLRKETMDSLIEVGYFVNKYIDTKLYEEVLSPTQINRIIKLKIDSNVQLDKAFYKYMPEDNLKKYLMLRVNGNNTGVSDAWRSGISEAKLDLDELEAIKKLLPGVKVNIDRYDLTDGHDLFFAIYANNDIITLPKVKENLDKLTKYQVQMLIYEYPELTKYLVNLEGFNELGTWQLSNILEKDSTGFKAILDNVSEEKKLDLLDRLKYTNLLPLLIRDKYIVINTEEEYKPLRYTLLYDNKSKAFVYKPDLLRFVTSSYDLEKVLSNQPTLFKHLGDRINDITDYDLKDIIVKNPRALKYIPEERFDKMGEYRIYNLIYSKPILARQLYDKVGMNYIIDLIKSVPKVIQYLPDSVLNQLDKYDMVSILYKKELYPYMEPIIDKFIPDDKDFILDRI
jgi:hypothetical protein